MEQYRLWTLKNIETISTIESSLRSLLFLLPGRFRDSEVKLETAYTAIGLFSFFHDLIIFDYLQRTKQLKDFPDVCVSTAKFISFLQAIQLLVEIFSKQKWGDKGKWSAVAVLESIKMCLKFLLLWKLGGKTICHRIPNYRDGNNLDFTLPPPIEQSDHSLHSISRDKPPQQRRTRRSVSSLKQRYLVNENMRESRENPVFFEILHIIRPLVYFLAMFLYGTKSWKAWGSSLSIDLLSLSYYLKSFQKLNTSERDEINWRRWILIYYLLRSPLFEVIKEWRLGKNIFKKAKNVPLLGGVFGSLWEYLIAYREYYFFISGT